MKILIGLIIVFSMQAAFSKTCSKKITKDKVKGVCSYIEKNTAALKKLLGDKKGLRKFLNKKAPVRFDNCGKNYVWIQDSDVKMIFHPIKKALDGKDLKPIKDPDGVTLFVNFDKKAKANKAGGWSDYKWTKPKAEKATDKTSFIMVCGGGLKWIAGSGIWKSDL